MSLRKGFGRSRARDAADSISSGSYTSTRSRSTTTAQGFVYSNDRRRVQRVDIDVPVLKRARLSVSGNTNWTPTSTEDVAGAIYDEYVPLFTMGDGPACEEVGEVIDCTTGKRKAYQSDNPMLVWRGQQQLFLDELLRHEGLGSDSYDPACLSCNASHSDQTRLVKCEACGVFLECEHCCVERHRCLPHHAIKVWNGRYWDKSTSLSDLGLVYQLGHGGHACPAPLPRTAMTLITPTRICRLAVAYCGCSRSSNATRVQQLLREGWYPATTQEPNTCATFAALDHFELLAVVANVNVRDFVSTLERADNALHLSKMPDVYKAFGRMSRQWGFLLRMMRAGRGHDEEGIQGTSEGEAAVPCWACPRDNINMPSDWRNASAQAKFIHTLFLSNDANFRLKNRLRHNARPDAPLGPGFGCIVEPTKYLEHIKRSASESDVSSCISFAALMEKNTKITTGCRVSGAGATSCTRHECVRPTGFGDLQKGERYANMDYIFWSALLNGRVDNVMVTYDIGCQWKVNLKKRLEDMPRHLRLIGPSPKIDVRLPVWHGNVHELSCRSANSVRYAKGAGKPDGEGPERIWSKMNAIAYATKEMGPGAREDTIERFLGHHNVQKNALLGPTLDRRHIIASQQVFLRKEELDDLEADLKPSTLEAWRAMYERYEEDPSSAPNPFMPQVSAPPSEQAVKTKLVQEEADAARHGKAPLRATSKTTFVVAALHLEEQQRHIAALAKDVTLTAIERQRNLEEARIAWFKKLAHLRHHQEVYMPGAVLKVRAAEDSRPSDAAPPNAEDVMIWLPSDLTRREREDGCVEGLAEIEVRLRVAQATDALKKIREQMFAKHYLINERNANVVGQRDTTRARKFIERVDVHIARHRDKYRHARSALHHLNSPDAYPAFRDLKDSDLTMDDDREADGASTNQLATAGSRGAKVIPNSRKTNEGMTRHDREIAAVRRADSRHTMKSWIWTCLGGPVEDEEAEVHDALRVEWAKARARCERWTEERMLLEEEMQRVLRSLRWESSLWAKRAEGGAWHDEVTRAGLRAYALRQSALRLDVEASFRIRWSLRMPQLLQHSGRHATLTATAATSTSRTAGV